MPDVIVIDAVRTPVGRRDGSPSGIHPANVLAHAQRALIQRAGIDPAQLGQVAGGCVGQLAGELPGIEMYSLCGLMQGGAIATAA